MRIRNALITISRRWRMAEHGSEWTQVSVWNVPESDAEGRTKPLPGRLDRSAAEYLRRIEKLMYNEAIETEDDWAGMLSSAFEEIKNQEYEVCGDVVGSRVVERLLTAAADHGQLALFSGYFEAVRRPQIAPARQTCNLPPPC
jgi:hypothetical protein